MHHTRAFWMVLVGLPLLHCSGDPSESPTPGESPGPTASPPPTATPAHTPAPTPESTPTPEPTPTSAPYPACRTITGDDGGMTISLNGGDTLISNVTPIKAVSYTWDVDVSPDGYEVLESFMNQLYRSTDGGCSYRLVPDVPENPIGFKEITRDPLDPSRIFLTGYDDEHLLRTDDGQTWTNESLLWEGTPITGVVGFQVDPITPGVLRLVSAEGGYFVSKDDGLHWTRAQIPSLLSAQIYPVGVSFHPTEPGVVLVNSNIDGFVRTDDDGLHWSFSNEGIYENGDTGATRALVAIWSQFSPADPRVVYGVISYPDIGKLIYRSDDGGLSWTRLTSTGLVLTGGTRIFAHPTDPDRFYTWFGTTFGDVYTDLYRCTVSGSTVTSDTVRYSFPDLFGMAFHPLDPEILFLGRVNDAPQ